MARVGNMECAVLKKISPQKSLNLVCFVFEEKHQLSKQSCAENGYKGYIKIPLAQDAWTDIRQTLRERESCSVGSALHFSRFLRSRLKMLLAVNMSTR